MSLTKEQNRTLNSISEKLCDIRDSLSEGDSNTEILEQILEALLDQPQIESLSPIPFCEDGAITGYTAYILDEETGAVTPIYFDATGVPTTVAPTGEPCAAKPDTEFKFFEKEKCLADGSKVLEVLCILYEDGVEVNTSTFWIVNGVKVDVDPGVVDCEQCGDKGSQGTILDWNVLK